MRLDQYLAINHYFESRNQAAAAIKKGYFAVNGKVTTRPSCQVPEGAQVVQVKNAPQYVARSAHKLLHGFACFKPDWAGKIVADFGASTGGFCQVLLEHGVGKIYARYRNSAAASADQQGYTGFEYGACECPLSDRR